MGGGEGHKERAVQETLPRLGRPDSSPSGETRTRVRLGALDKAAGIDLGPVMEGGIGTGPDRVFPGIQALGPDYLIA